MDGRPRWGSRVDFESSGAGSCDLPFLCYKVPSCSSTRLLPAPPRRVRRAEPRASKRPETGTERESGRGDVLTAQCPMTSGSSLTHDLPLLCTGPSPPIAQPPSLSARDTGKTGLTWKQGGPEGLGRTLEARQAPSQSIIPSISTWDRRDTTQRAGQAGFPAQRVPYNTKSRLPSRGIPSSVLFNQCQAASVPISLGRQSLLLFPSRQPTSPLATGLGSHRCHRGTMERRRVFFLPPRHGWSLFLVITPGLTALSSSCQPQ
jgi:hypothetical protein